MQQTKTDKILQFKFYGFCLVYAYNSNKYVNESTRDDNLFVASRYPFWVPQVCSSALNALWNCEAV